MKKIFGMTLLASLAFAPVALEAQQSGAPAQERSARAGGPFAMLIARQAELGLASEQVARLEEIGQRLRAQNEPLMEQLRASGAFHGRDRARSGERPELSAEQREQMRARMQEQRQRLRDMTPEQRDQMRAQMRERRQQAQGERGHGAARGAHQLPEELRPTMEQVRANMRAAREEAQAVLTPEQQTRLGEMMQQRRGSGERMHRGPAVR